VSGKILSNILRLSLRMGAWFLNNSSAVLPGASAVGICIVDADGDRVAEANSTDGLMGTKLSDDDRAFSYVELNTMRVNPYPDGICNA